MERVILGMPGPWAASNYEAADIYTSKVGGIPDWPLPIADENSGVVECSSCSNKLSLLAQIYAPISSESLATKDRVIYVLCCLVPECASLSCRALRVQKNSNNEAVHVPSSPISSSNLQNDVLSYDIGQELEDEEEDDIDLDELADAFAEAANISFTSKKQNNPVDSTVKHHCPSEQARPVDSNLPVMPCFYLWSQEEKQSKNDDIFNSSKKAMPSNRECSEQNSDDEKYEAEGYEYDRTLHADRTYLKFKKRLDAYPEQCFRYSYGGKPLVASQNSVGDIVACSACGEARHYEMQLMPPLIYFLQEEADHQRRTYTEKLDWTTLIIYTCSKSCGNTSSGAEEWTVSEEAVIVQND